ncbi:glycoside hydrolase family 3 protein [Actinocatenispora comari]|uniref:glycoside hydrolase family 3 protein n=1 Tax=Actinocatenispora comari TaxID=2807577 RepID=UPI001A9174FB|nr:glycoside hydrolase family 3 N-terminal domain-containing protein [Actinocatenispora comari]
MTRPSRTSRSLSVAAAVLAGLLLAAGCGSDGSGAGDDHPGRSAAPTPTPSGDPAEQAAYLVRHLSDAELVGQVLMPVAYGYRADSVSKQAAAHNRSTAGADTPAQIVRKYHLGGLMLVNEGGGAGDPTAETNPTSNIATPGQVRRLTGGLQQAGRTAGLPMLVGTDQEFGTVLRIGTGISPLPTGLGVGAAHDAKLTRTAWAMAGSELAALGVNVDFAPDADVLGGPGNTVIGSRSFGSDPTAVAGQVSAAVGGLQSAGVAASPKHFPGHGHTSTDSHQAMPVLTQSRAQLDAQDLPPFRAAITAGSWLIMAGHLDVQSVDPGVPATLSHKLLHDVLRGQLHYDGVVVSDALNMAPITDRYDGGQAAVHALLAGNDLLLEPPNLAAAQHGLLAAVKSGQLPRSRLVEAAQRVLTLRARLARFRQPAASTVHSAGHEKVARQVAAAAMTVLRGKCSGPLVSGTVRLTGGTGQKRAWLAAALRADGVSVGDSGATRVALTGYGDTTADLAPDAAVTVAMDEPYLAANVHSPTVLASFGATKESMGAVADVLAGKAAAPGRSPVEVPGLPRSAC